MDALDQEHGSDIAIQNEKDRLEQLKKKLQNDLKARTKELDASEKRKKEEVKQITKEKMLPNSEHRFLP